MITMYTEVSRSKMKEGQAEFHLAFDGCCMDRCVNITAGRDNQCDLTLSPSGTAAPTHNIMHPTFLTCTRQ